MLHQTEALIPDARRRDGQGFWRILPDGELLTVKYRQPLSIGKLLDEHSYRWVKLVA